MVSTVGPLRTHTRTHLVLSDIGEVVVSKHIVRCQRDGFLVARGSLIQLAQLLKRDS